MQRQVQTRVSKVMTQPIQLCFRFLQNQERLQVWLVDQKFNRIEGVLKGFDEYMNLVLDDAVEINIKNNDPTKNRKIGRILLKGENVATIQQIKSAV
jgi:small nuclear ribonucleoprotein E